MLKLTKTKLELITDPNMYIFFEKAMKVEFRIFLINIAKQTINI